MRLVQSIIITAVLVFTSSNVLAQATWHVDDDAPLGGDGTSWSAAYKYLQDSLLAASNGDQIRIAGGTYKPDQDEGGLVNSGDRFAAFQLVNGVSIFGGYAGFANPENPDESNIGLYETILSGDLDGNDTPDLANNGDNSLHVIKATNNVNVTLEGLTVSGGNANYFFIEESGGGLSIIDSDITLRQLQFINNHSFGKISYGRYFGGGAVYIYRSIVDITSSVFQTNTSTYGGAILASDDSKLTLQGCFLTDNQNNPGGSNSKGGALFIHLSTLSLQNCELNKNEGLLGKGGAIYSLQSSLTIADSKFDSNSASEGGAILVHTHDKPLNITNCNFSNNWTAEEGGALYLAASNANIENSTFDGNTVGDKGGAVYIESSNTTFTNCELQNNFAGRGGAIFGKGTNNNLTIQQSIFQMNEAGFIASGVFFETSGLEGELLIEDTLFKDNIKRVIFINQGTSVISKCKFIHNLGGCIESHAWDITLNRCDFVANGSQYVSGSAINSYGPATMSDCVIFSNVSKRGAIHIRNGLTVLNNCVVYNNHTNDFAGGIYGATTGSQAIVANSVLFQNSDSNGISQASQFYFPSGKFRVSYSCIQGLTENINGIGNIGLSPEFVDPDSGDFHLLPSSPLIDAGDPDFQIELTEYDLDGEPRIQQCRVDIGVDETDYYSDCNDNNLPDACETLDDVEDCNADLVPDVCQLDDNDCDFNNIPDDCEPDCNENTINDFCEITSGQADDCDNNLIPDECDLIYPRVEKFKPLNSNAWVGHRDDHSPQLAAIGPSQWIAVWQSYELLDGDDGLDKDIHFSRSFDNGITWSAPAALNSNASIHNVEDFAPRMAIDPTGSIIVVWQSHPTNFSSESDILYSKSDDFGDTWSESKLLNFGSNGNKMDKRNRVPQIATDGVGNWIAAWFSNYDPDDSSGGEFRVYYAISMDNGVTWTNASVLEYSGFSIGSFDPTIVSDGLGTLVLVWSDSFFLPDGFFRGTNIYAARSIDHGLSWSEPIQLNGDKPSDQKTNRFPFIATNQNGQLMVVWNCENAICVNKSVDSGVNWDGHKLLYFNDDINGAPHLATNNGGSWIAAWSTRFGPWGTDFDVLFSYSLDHGTTWSGAQLLNIDTMALSNQEISPQIANDYAGNWLSVWTSNSHLNLTVGTDHDIMVAPVRLDTTDCNNNGQLDQCEIANSTSQDCNNNGIPDDCEERIDTDSDGLIDECDTCPESNTDITIIINDCDTNVPNELFDDGCTMADAIAECLSGIRRHDNGKNVSCTVELANDWLRSRLITAREFSQIVRCNARTFNPSRNTLKNIRPYNP